MVGHIVAAHGGHLSGSWLVTFGAVVVSVALLVLVALVMDGRRAP